ncbi:hypothetical protein ACFP1H_09540 [Secundilactobacillus hailunensis]|uniref:Bacterial Ig domain-containing protein n=1 Tax=Secundilactobacillus hailunensis TaxID=2559923 RepID=A0ABW1TAX6_9LACO|nr:hypothetical protein [Secundilactobacillus hailunensis]
MKNMVVKSLFVAGLGLTVLGGTSVSASAHGKHLSISMSKTVMNGQFIKGHATKGATIVLSRNKATYGYGKVAKNGTFAIKTHALKGGWQYCVTVSKQGYKTAHGYVTVTKDSQTSDTPVVNSSSAASTKSVSSPSSSSKPSSKSSASNSSKPSSKSSASNSSKPSSKSSASNSSKPSSKSSASSSSKSSSKSSASSSSKSSSSSNQTPSKATPTDTPTTATSSVTTPATTNANSAFPSWLAQKDLPAYAELQTEINSYNQDLVDYDKQLNGNSQDLNSARAQYQKLTADKKTTSSNKTAIIHDLSNQINLDKGRIARLVKLSEGCVNEINTLKAAQQKFNPNASAVK